MEESTALNIVYLPDEKTRVKAIELSQKVALAFSTEFVLGEEQMPHITIYQALFPNKNIEKLKGIIKEIAQKTHPFQIEMGAFLANVGVPGFFWWSCVKSEKLQQIHLETLKLANPLREGLIPDGLKDYSGSEENKRDIKNYGSLLVEGRYGPHITITRLKNPLDSEKALELLGSEKSAFVADKIALGYLAEHGTVIGIIDTFPLG